MLMWAAECTMDECKYACSILGRVMSRPSKVAFKAGIHTLAWMRSQRLRGTRYSEDGNKIPKASVDASGKQDPKDYRDMHGYTGKLASGPLFSIAHKLPKVEAGMPGREYIALRSAGGHVVWLRNLLKEMGFAQLVEAPTVIECDSSGAIDWAKHGKITTANRSIGVAYHQCITEWQNKFKEVYYLKIPGMFNCADLETKAVTVREIQRMLQWHQGYSNLPDLSPSCSTLATWEEYCRIWDEYNSKL